MSKLFARIAGIFSSRSLVGMDKSGNRYFTRNEVIDGVIVWLECPAEANGVVLNLNLTWDSRNNHGQSSSPLVDPIQCIESISGRTYEDLKEKRWVVFKGEEDPTSVPVEWICWLNGQRKKAPTPEEMAELEARREFTRQNVERLKKEEEERRAMLGNIRHGKIAEKVGGPDLPSFLRQVPTTSGGSAPKETSEAAGGERNSEEAGEETTVPPQERQEPRTTEPTGTGPSFRPGTWQPPS